MADPAAPQEVEDLEIDLLLEGIWRRYGYDLRDYDRRFIRERVQGRLREERLFTASQLLERVLREPASLDGLLDDGGPAARSFFRPARAWKALRQKALPLLRTYPSVRAWTLGSSEGDLYSLLIVLEEELSRSYKLYATDLHERRLRRTRSGVFRRPQLRALEKTYAAAGGRGTLLDHFQTTNGSATLRPALRGRLVFASHNPATDASFNEFHLILARSAMKSFGGSLRTRVQRLIDESLVRFGFLVLDPGETPEGFPGYRLIDRGAGLYQKMAE